MPTAARAFSRRDSVLLVACVLTSIIARGLPDRLRDPVAATLRQTVLTPLVAMQRDAELTHRAWQSREARTLAQDSLALRSMTLDAVQAENERLRLLLGLGQELRWGFVPAEVLTGRGVGEDYTVTLSIGSRSGVKPFSPVVAPEGLVGMVKTVDPSMSIAILSAHPDFRVSAMAADGSAFGIVATHLGAEPERYLMEMRGVPIRSTLKPGTLIVSSGLGSTFPRGIPLGMVLGEIRTSELWARTYLLRPAVMPSEVTSVMVLLPERAHAGVESVWRAGRSSDSAARGVIAAADSIARVNRADSLATADPQGVSRSDARVRAPAADSAEVAHAAADSARRRRARARARAESAALADPSLRPIQHSDSAPKPPDVQPVPTPP
ncbi:MAG TPA: rod shape-determining protein MreC [Gemmatimonadaceae bacterium]|nr:rod shape-determining protein MreC [Gemmatimonadaceae bacterium]